MSDARQLAAREDDADPSIEARARAQGWKPLEEYHGAPDGWRDAETYLRRGEQELPLMRERNRDLERRFIALQRSRDEDRLVLADMAERTRKSEERAYARARADVERERQEAVALGDTQRFDAAERQLKELDESKPAPPPPKPAAAPPEMGAVPREVAEWGAKNPWFGSNPDLRERATRLHVDLLQSEPELSLTENLERVTDSMRVLYPSRIVGAARPPRQQESEPPANEPEPPANPRRAAPASVGGAREGGPRRAAPNSFDAMPQDSKDAYARYARAIDGKDMGKGKPLTKEEWAKTYWEQD